MWFDLKGAMGGFSRAFFYLSRRLSFWSETLFRDRILCSESTCYEILSLRSASFQDDRVNKVLVL